MQIRNIIDCFNKNNVSYDSKLINVERDGCISDYQNLYNEIIVDMEQLIRYGINNGFSSAVKDSLTKLSKTIVKICDETTKKKLDKYCAEVSEMRKDATKIMKNASTTDIRTEVIKYVDTCIRAANVLLGYNMAESRKPILTESVKKLEELKKVLENVMDVSTTDALKNAQNIIKNIKAWAGEVSISMHNENTVNYITTAIEQANVWSADYIGVSSGIFKKDNRIKDESSVKFVKDDMYAISISAAVLGDIKNFSENLKEYQQSISEGRFNYEADEKLLEEKKAKRKALEEEKQENVNKYQNGRMTREDLINECREIDEDIQDLQEDIDNLREDVKNKKADKRIYDRTIKEISKLNDYIMSYQKEPVMLTFLGGRIDFAVVTRVLRGVASEEDINSLADMVATLEDLRGIGIEVLKGTKGTIADVKTNIRNGNNEKQEKKTPEQQKKEDDEYFARLTGGVVPQPDVNEKPVTETNDTSVIAGIVDDDR